MAIINDDNLISNLSYTEKDFQVIYPALLDLVKKVTARWDPSASNESDPGVLLLKLNAIIADKCNYNIDKNVLECFPVSVTQQQNARQLFEQLGYYMHWYQAASSVVTLRYISDKLTDDAGSTLSYSIPKFTMVCDESNSAIYTLIDDGNLSTDGTPLAFKALQGIVETLDINGETLITVANLDGNNRIYFPVTSIAENGIFIKNKGLTNYSSWEKKDNLLIEELSDSNFFYKFGVSQDLNTCYLEFPENAEELFQEGINITYISTDGSAGNIAANMLTNLYEGLEVINPLNTDETVALTTDSIKINNYVIGTGGQDTETIDEAYLGYKKVVGTFDTLITLRDYMNAVRRSEYASNAIVCDRTNDVQVAYKIMSENGSVDQAMNELEKASQYDIIGYFDGDNFYADSTCSYKYAADDTLNYYANNTSPPKYANKSYRVLFKNSGEDFEYVEADPTARVAMEAFDLKLYLLTATSLMKTAVNYKSSFTLDTESTDYAIVETELDDYKCMQYEIRDLLPNKICFIKNKYPINCKIIPQYAVTEPQKDEIVQNIELALYENLNAAKVEFGEELAYETIYNIILEADSRIKTLSLEPLTYTPYVVYLKQTDLTTGSSELVEEDLSEYITKKNSEGEVVIDWDELVNQFRVEIYAKSVLAGRTQFFVKDATFNYGLNQKYQLLKTSIGKLKTNLDVTLNASNDWQYPLKENEALQVYAPNLIEYATYSNNIKFEYYLHNDLSAGTTYMLQDDEYIIFYWLDSTIDNGYTYAIYGKGTILRPSFNMNNPVSKSQDLIGQELRSKVVDVTINSYTYKYYTGNTLDEDVSSTLTEAVATLTESKNLLSSNKTVYIAVKNSIIIDSSKYSCYWILNEEHNGKYILFDQEIGVRRILKAGEYFIYTTNTNADMTILGAGTEITRPTPAEGEEELTISCVAIDYTEIMENGILALIDYWVTIEKKNALTITEMQYTALGEGTIAQIKPKTPTLVQLENFTTDVKYEYYVHNSMTKDLSYVLKSGDTSDEDEYLICYWKGDLVENYNYAIYGPGSVISPNIDLTNPVATQAALVGNSLITECEEMTAYTKETEIKGLTFTDLSYMYATGDTNSISTALTEAVAKITQILKTAEIIDTFAYDKPKITEITLNSDVPANLNYCNIKYKESVSDIAWTILPTITLENANFSWQGLTLLRLKVSSSSPQTLVTGETITYYTYDSNHNWIVDGEYKAYKDYYTTEEWETVKPGVIDPTESPYVDPTYLLTSSAIEDIGPTISTLTYDSNKIATPLAIYAYIDGEKTEDVIALDDGKTNILFRNCEDQTQQKDLTFKLPQGQYILPISHETDSGVITNLEVLLTIPGESSPRKLASMGDATLTNFYEAGNYYLRIKDLPEDASASFFLTLSVKITYKTKPASASEAPAVSILFAPIFKYEPDKALGDTTYWKDELFTKIYEKIQALDYHHRFNYAYIVDEDIEISDPLDATSFLDPNHIMNPFTICQMDTTSKKYNIQVTNIIK